jgi:benzoyl-CoA reductase subunit A
MITAGIDIGSLSANVVILRNDRITVSHNIRTGPDTCETSWQVMKRALAMMDRNFSVDNIDYIVATGYGRVVVPFSNKTITEISCHAKGNHFFFPKVRTILDMGGQDCKAISCDEKGKVTNFIMNDKCAAGTGRYLERVASTLGVSLADLGQLSLQTVKGPANISHYCAVFAQQDILLLKREGEHLNDILAGACEGIVKRIYPLLQQLGIPPDFAISGGVAKNIGIVTRLEKKLGMKANIAFDSQIVGALVAALFAREFLLSCK